MIHEFKQDLSFLILSKLQSTIMQFSSEDIFSTYHFQLGNSQKKKKKKVSLMISPTCISRLEGYISRILTYLFTGYQLKVWFFLNQILSISESYFMQYDVEGMVW